MECVWDLRVEGEPRIKVRQPCVLCHAPHPTESLTLDLELEGGGFGRFRCQILEVDAAAEPPYLCLRATSAVQHISYV